MGIGAVVRDHSGRFLGAIPRSGGKASNALSAELLAIREACLYALEGGFWDCLLESDCLEAVKLIKGSVSAGSLDQLVVRDI